MADSSKDFNEEEYFKFLQKREAERNHFAKVSGVPAKYTNAGFRNFICEKGTELYKNVDRCEEFVKGNFSSLVLAGKNGAGKTHLAVATMRCMPKVKSYEDDYMGIGKIQHYKSSKGIFLPWGEFYDELSDAQSTGKRTWIYRTKLGHDVVCIDDIRFEDLTPSGRRLLFSAIDHVYSVGRKLIITMNYTFEGLRSHDRAIADRLEENSIHLEFTNESHRRKT